MLKHKRDTVKNALNEQRDAGKYPVGLQHDQKAEEQRDKGADGTQIPELRSGADCVRHPLQLAEAKQDLQQTVKDCQRREYRAEPIGGEQAEAAHGNQGNTGIKGGALRSLLRPRAKVLDNIENSQRKQQDICIKTMPVTGFALITGIFRYCGLTILYLPFP